MLERKVKIDKGGLNMKYAIQVSYYMYNSEIDEEYEEWLYLGIEGKLKVFVFEEEINEKTKIFDTAKKAGEYVDKHFGADDQRISYSKVRIVEVKS